MITLNAQIHLISPNEIIEINQKNIISFNGNINYRENNTLPSYGIISNFGNLEFNDIDGKVLEYAEKGALVSSLLVTITIINTLISKVEQVAVFETKEWNYDNNNYTVSVSLQDNLQEWQDIQVKGFYVDTRDHFKIITYGKMSNVYKWLQSQDENGNYRTPLKYQMLSFEELDDKTKDILENTIIPYPFLKDGNLWQQWLKLCQVCGLYIYKNNYGKTVCSYTYGS